MPHKRLRFFPRTDQLSVLTAVIGLGYAVSRFLHLPTRILAATLFGSPISVRVDGQLILLLLLTALITTGTDVLMRSHPLMPQDPLDLRPLRHWIVPALTALSVGVLLNGFSGAPLWFAGLLAGATLLVLVLVAEYVVIDAGHPAFAHTQIGLTVLTYLVALVWFGWVAQLGARGALSATSTLLIGGLISFRLLSLYGVPASHAGLNSLAVGLILAELMWVLGYWALPPLVVGAWLLLVLHLAVGLIRKGHSKGISGRTVLEHVLVAVIALALTALLVVD
jgi:hypothetical protein